MLSFLHQENTALALATLESIDKSKLEPSAELSLALANSLAHADDFQLSSSILTMLANYSLLPEEVLITLTSILKDQSFLKARGVYWLLSDYPLPNNEQDELKRFYQTNWERL
ncbi:hypothetical protein [Paraglaciecola sp. L3A3]|uniref:hypothetical protein n=1 Tax=Paraglaciecola sp. L3A3 TaxID=2686358 RepID=UPI00131CE126|nr:hypothetical protein [Paraglaciecola sp. L3A3]